MSKHDIIVVGASAGGVEALIALTRGLPADLPAAVFVVTHLSALYPSALPEILSRAGPLKACHAADGAAIAYGCIYIAPPDHHMLVEPGKVRVVRGPKENRSRPAIDPLFRSAAQAYGPRVVGVILSGALDDGAAGLLAVKRCGGIAVVQDPREALYPGMPLSALRYVNVDFVLPVASIALLLVRLVTGQGGQRDSSGEEQRDALPGSLEEEIRAVTRETVPLHSLQPAGTLSTLSCPLCGSALWAIQEEHLLRFRCRAGHAFSPANLFAGQAERLESALEGALKTLGERAELVRWLSASARERGESGFPANEAEKLQRIERQIALIKQMLVQDETMVEPFPAENPAAVEKLIDGP